MPPLKKASKWPGFRRKRRQRIARVIATPSKAGNPIDLFPDMLAHGFEKTSLEVLNALLDDSGVDGIIFISFANFGEQPYRPIVEGLEGRVISRYFSPSWGQRRTSKERRPFWRNEAIPALTCRKWRSGFLRGCGDIKEQCQCECECECECEEIPMRCTSRKTIPVFGQGLQQGI